MLAGSSLNEPPGLAILPKGDDVARLAPVTVTFPVPPAAREGDKLIIDATCKVAKTTATTHAVITGKFDSAYKIESKSTFDPPLRGEREGTAVLEARWTGACKPNQKPGDVMLPSGAKINVTSDKGPAHKAMAEKEAARRQQAHDRKEGGYVPGHAPTK